MGLFKHYKLRKCHRCGKVHKFVVFPQELKERPHYAYWYCERCGNWNKIIVGSEE